MNYLFLLDKKRAELFFNENSEKIFGEVFTVKIKNITRYKTYNEEGSLNILYSLLLNDREFLTRVSTSTFLNKEHDYNVMSYLYQHGFNRAPFLVPKPFAYLQKEKILFYENIFGEKLTDLLDQEYEKLDQYMKNCALSLQKFHLLPAPSFELYNSESLFKHFKFNDIINKYPEIKNLEKITQALDSSLSDKKIFCHGDFNPNNIIIQKDKTVLIDFGLTTVYNREIDLASFITHLRIMMASKLDLNIKLIKSFLTSYGDYDEKNLKILLALIDIRLLEISIIFTSSGFNSSTVFNFLKDDLKKLNIKW